MQAGNQAGGHARTCEAASHLQQGQVPGSTSGQYSLRLDLYPTSGPDSGPGLVECSGVNSEQELASERRGDNEKGFKDFDLKAKAKNLTLTVLHVPSSLDSGCPGYLETYCLSLFGFANLVGTREEGRPNVDGRIKVDGLHRRHSRFRAKKE